MPIVLTNFTASTASNLEQFESLYLARHALAPTLYPLNRENPLLWLEAFSHFCQTGELLIFNPEVSSDTPKIQAPNSVERFRSAMNLSSDWYWEQDSEFRLTVMEGRIKTDGTTMRGVNVGKRRWETGLEIVGGWDAHRALLDSRMPFRDAVMYRKMASDSDYSVTADGGIRYMQVSGEPMFDQDGQFTGYRGFGRDITEKIIAEERIAFLATHDGLTSLPNRTMFNEILNSTTQTARRYKRQFSVVFLDLDGFKPINDRFGHDVGDKLLQEVAKRLTACVRTSDVVARLGGDEFVLLLQEVGDVQNATVVAQKLLAAIAMPAHIDGNECRVTASLGISIFPLDAQDGAMLIKCADSAMYVTKEKGKNQFQFYKHPDLTRISE